MYHTAFQACLCHGAEFPIVYIKKLIGGDPQGRHSRGQLCGEGSQSWDKHTDTNMFILRRPWRVSFIINIAFLVNFIGCSFASRLILLSFVKPVLYILHLRQNEARFTGYGLCPTSRVHSLSRRRDQSQSARFSIRRRYPRLTMACTEFANGPVGRYSVTSTIAQKLTLSRNQNSWIQKTPVT